MKQSSEWFVHLRSDSALSELSEKVPGISELLRGEVNEADEPVLTIKEFLWMSIELEEIPWGEHMALVGTIAYRRGLINEVEFYSLVKTLFSLGLMDDTCQLQMIESLIDKCDSFEAWVEEVLNWCYLLALPVVPLEKLISHYRKEVSDFDSHEWEKLASNVSTMNYWPEGFEFADTSDDTLLKMLPWLPLDNQKRIVDELLRRFTDPIDPSSWGELDLQIQENDFLREFPTSFNVYSNKLAKIPPRTVDPDVFTNYPPELVQEVAFRYAYSRPETEETFKIHFLGGERIGHSAILVKTKSAMILLDFGMTVINNRMARWSPLLEKIDAVLLSHAHLDHSGGLPVLKRITGSNVRTPVFGTERTKIMTEMLFRDTKNVLSRRWTQEAIERSPEVAALLEDANISSVLDMYSTIEIGKPFSPAPNMTVTAHHASHLFGSVGYEIEIGSKRLFYTGDFNLNSGRLFDGAKFPVDDVDVLLFDGTNFGKYEEEVPTSTLEQILKEHDRIIIPAFAMGRSQEMLYRLMDLGAHKDRKIFVTGMGGRLLKLLNLAIKSSNIELAPTIAHQELRENTVLIAGNGMLQAGTSRNILDWTKDDDDVAVVFCGYQSPNTFGHALLNGHPKLKQEYRQQVYRVKISGHSDADSLDNFLGGVQGKQVIVHSPEGAWEKGRRDGVLRPRDIEGNTI